MSTIPRANTQIGVNQTVIRTLESAMDFSKPKTLLDVPCGNGEFGRFLKKSFPNLKVIGVDVLAETSEKIIRLNKMTAAEFFQTNKKEKFDAITCISGVMCFDGIYNLFESFQNSLNSNGILIVTNDNTMTVRDRLSFMFFGSFKRFKLLYANNEGNWNVLLPQAIMMLFRRNNFQNISVKYTSIYPEDFLFMPLALLIYPIFLVNLILMKSEMPLGTRIMLFPFRSLIARHYVISGHKTSREASYD